MQDLYEDERRAKIGEMQEELEPQVPRKWYVHLLWGVVLTVGVIAFLYALVFLQFTINY